MTTEMIDTPVIVEYTAAQLQVLANIWAKAKTQTLNRRPRLDGTPGVGYVTTISREFVGTQDQRSVAALLANETLVPHYKNYFKIVMAEGTELPAPVVEVQG